MSRISPYILSLDIGTSSVRSQVYDAKGVNVDNIGIQIPYRMERTADGGEFINLESLFQIILQALDRAVEDAKNQSLAIAAIATCTFWHNVVGIDASGTPCTALLSWSDTRPQSVLPLLKSKLDTDAYTRRTGCPIHSSYLPAKILWFYQIQLESIKSVRYWMSVGEYVLYRITGQRVCSYSMASATGLLHSAHCVWDEQTLSRLPLPIEQLSPLCDADTPLSPMLPEYRKHWPTLQEAVWFPALGDGACSNIGSGCVTPDRFALMVGTSGAMRAIWRGEYREPPPGLWCYRIDRNRPIQGGALSNGGNLFEWMQTTLSLPPMEAIEQELRSLPPDSHGLTILPFLAGQRSPHWNPNICGTIHGLRLSTKPIHIVQAGLEAIAFRFRLIHDLLSKRFDKDHVVVATGGGLLHSPAWIQIMADVLGYPVCVSLINEASCRGAALKALESLGILADLSDANPGLGEIFTPRENAQAAYRKACQRHLDLENKLTDSASS